MSQTFLRPGPTQPDIPHLEITPEGERFAELFCIDHGLQAIQLNPLANGLQSRGDGDRFINRGVFLTTVSDFLGDFDEDLSEIPVSIGILNQHITTDLESHDLDEDYKRNFAFGVANLALQMTNMGLFFSREITSSTALISLAGTCITGVFSYRNIRTSRRLKQRTANLGEMKDVDFSFPGLDQNDIGLILRQPA